MITGQLYLLDTNTVTYLVSARSENVQRRYLQAEQLSRIAISAITSGEIHYGLSKKPEAHKIRNYMQRFLDRTEILPWDDSVAAPYSTLRAQLQARGLMPGPLDLMIAGHAIAAKAILVTHDRALKRLTDFIAVEDWTTDT